MDDEPVIHVAGLVKQFGRTRALDGFDLEVQRGEVHGLLGPNGAGKSTTIRILLGLMRGGSGTARLLGGDAWRDAVALHRRLAFVPDDVQLWPGLTGGEAIDLLGALRGGMDPARRDALIERFRLDPTKRCRTYSKGNRQKVAIVSAFASDVDLYIMDEPTTGLDPLMTAVFRECVAEARQRGCTVLLSSHILADVEALCDRVTIIRDGRRVESGTLRGMRHLTRTTIEVQTRRAADSIAGKPGVHGFEHGDGQVRFEVEPQYLDAALRHLGGLGVQSIVCHPPTLEDLFMRHYRSRGGERPGWERRG